MNKTLGCVIGVVVALVLLAVVVGVSVFGTYNGLVNRQQAVEAQWAQVENVYQRRADLVPNLVRTVQGAADFEQQTLQNVIDARSRVGQMQVSEEILNDPQRFAQFEQAQDQLSSALSRLLVVVERYPQLRSVPAFQDLMVQLEGTENRINVARTRYNEAVRDYNTSVRSFPANIMAGILGFDRRVPFEAEAGAEQAPTVDFDS